MVVAQGSLVPGFDQTRQSRRDSTLCQFLLFRLGHGLRCDLLFLLWQHASRYQVEVSEHGQVFDPHEELTEADQCVVRVRDFNPAERELARQLLGKAQFVHKFVIDSGAMSRLLILWGARLSTDPDQALLLHGIGPFASDLKPRSGQHIVRCVCHHDLILATHGLLLGVYLRGSPRRLPS